MKMEIKITQRPWRPRDISRGATRGARIKTWSFKSKGPPCFLQAQYFELARTTRRLPAFAFPRIGRRRDSNYKRQGQLARRDNCPSFVLLRSGQRSQERGSKFCWLSLASIKTIIVFQFSNSKVCSLNNNSMAGKLVEIPPARIHLIVVWPSYLT